MENKYFMVTLCKSINLHIKKQDEHTIRSTETAQNSIVTGNVEN